MSETIVLYSFGVKIFPNIFLFIEFTTGGGGV